MDKLKLFLIADGAIVLIGIIIFTILFLRRGNQSHFRDDLWAEKKKAAQEAHRKAVEDQVDQKILLEHRPDPKEPEEKPEPKRAEFRVPNFRGKPHEVLGVPENAPKDAVLRAYKHWIKRYHPDRVNHLGPKYIEQARKRAEQLNSARDELLKNFPS